MSTVRLLLALGALVGLEIGVFYLRHDDIVRLSANRTAVVSDDGFNEAARTALAREHVSRRVLERVADVAHERQAFDLQVQALERIVATVPADADARLRLAQALRDAGRLEDAERLYRAELGFGEGSGQ
jgi:DNA-binding SARP family transcriptional activator